MRKAAFRSVAAAGVIRSSCGVGITPDGIARALVEKPRGRTRPTVARREQLQQLRERLVSLTRVHYGRDAQLPETALDDALASGEELVASLRREEGWLTRSPWRPRPSPSSGDDADQSPSARCSRAAGTEGVCLELRELDVASLSFVHGSPALAMGVLIVGLSIAGLLRRW